LSSGTFVASASASASVPSISTARRRGGRTRMVATTAMSGGSATPAPPFRIAIVGGGITGAVAAAELSRLRKSENQAAGTGASASARNASVVLFDQGRRGPGGRASHRSVDPATGQVLMDNDVDDVHAHGHGHGHDNNKDKNKNKNKTLEFDHGCQFFRADSVRMQKLTNSWCANGWAAPWKARFGSLPMEATSGGASDSDSDTGSTSSSADFFGVPSSPDSVHMATGGGMHQLPRNILQHSQAYIRAGTRVSSVRRSTTDPGKWELMGMSGTAAFHDEALTAEQENQEIVLDTADAVLFTDISSSFDSWHRASAGIPDAFRQKLKDRPRVPLFSCMIALKQPIRHLLPHDTFTVNTDRGNNNDSPLWFAACSQSKPGMADHPDAAECWTLVGTPQFAVSEIKDTSMQDPVTGAFLPQENGYLNTIPGPALFQAFVDAVQPSLTAAAAGETGVAVVPETTYLQAQRWGSGLPAPTVGLSEEDIETVCGVRYAKRIPSLVYPRSDDATVPKLDYLADDEQGLYYAGDFCSQRNPGFEASALSGLDVAEHMIKANLLN
jgi:predicted NAD/FAD-dependent oxidoreductase